MSEEKKELNDQDLEKVTGGASPITAIDKMTHPKGDNLTAEKVVINNTKVSEDGHRYIVK